MTTADYYADLDRERWELGRSRAFAFGRRRWFSYTAPLWNSRYRVVVNGDGLRWTWDVLDQKTGREVASGRSWLLGRAIWAAERVAGA